MTFKNRPVVLFFLAGAITADSEAEQALKIERDHVAQVRFRNGRFPGEGAVERCNYVAGNAPANYRAKYPYIDDAGAIHAPTTTTNDESGTRETPVDTETPGTSSLAAEVGTVGGGWGAP